MTNSHAHGEGAHGANAAHGANYQYGHPGMYGSSAHHVANLAQKGPFLRGQRQRLNIVAILVCLFVPWLIFCLMYWTMAFSLHYKNPFMCWTIVTLGLCVVIIIAILAYDAVRRKKKDASEAVQFLSGANAYHEPTWLIFLLATCLLAWLLGVVGGDVNYFNHMEPYFDVLNLNTYPNVDPSRMRGQQLMDAGRIIFTQGTQLDLSRSIGFKNTELYCVAPIVAGDDPKHIPTYDFWAVGMNCCSGSRADFHCGQFNNAHAGAGLRLMRDDQRPFYRLAVQQAEAAYNIRADHPLFFFWLQDPIAEVASYADEGHKYFLIGIFAHFVFQLFLVLCACVVFSKLGRLA